MKLINPCNGGGSSPILAVFAGSSRTQAVYSPSTSSQVAVTSDLDITLTIPSGCTSVPMKWIVSGDVNANGNGRTGFVVYRDVDGGGFTLMPNARDGSANFYSVISTYTNENSTTTPVPTAVGIVDESPPASGSVCTYRLYVACTSSTIAGSFYLNKAVAAVGSEIESCLSFF